MDTGWRIDIAGLSIGLHEVDGALADLRRAYDAFDERSDRFKRDGKNPHLCHAGCSECCKRGAIFAVTLAEAVQWSLAIEALPAELRTRARQDAASLLELQARIFEQDDGPADVPGARDEALFTTRVSRLARTGAACPLLVDDLCAVYAGRPMLCRAYGFPVDAYAVARDDTMVFRSLCVLYEGMALTDYVRAKDLKQRLGELSRRICGGRDWCRFTSPEAILASVHSPSKATQATIPRAQR